MKPHPRFLSLLAFLTLSLFIATTAAHALPPLKVSENGRYLTTADGKPFFYLGDTAWELFHRLDREETELYLKNRAAKGFTVIQAVALAEFDGLTVPNREGNLPLIENDPTRPNEAYFKHIDWVVRQAEKRGMYIGFLPTWGDKWNKKWGIGPEIFNADNARIYGEFLGKRYKGRAIIWILGGDRPVENDTHFAIIRAMAAGIRAGNGGTQLMTLHPSGNQNSAKWFHNDDWLDFNMFQSGHGGFDIPNYKMILSNRALTPVKPTLDGEPRYEDHPVNWHQKGESRWFDDFDARQAAWWSMLSGAAGHTFGNHDIWQFWQEDRKPISKARTPWRDAMDQPGAGQMKHMRDLLTTHPWWKLVPDQSLIAGDAGQGSAHLRAARAEDNSFALVYLPTGRPVTLNLQAFENKTLRASWFNPRTGESTRISPVTGSFQSPESGRGIDWVLVVDAEGGGKR